MIVVFILSVLWWMKIVACESFLIGDTGCGENWILFCWARTSSVTLYSNCLLMPGTVFPPCSLAWGQTMVGVHCWSMPPLKMPVCLLWGHRFFLLGPVVHKVLLCLPRVCFSSSITKSHWPSKSDLLGVLSPFSGSTRCGLWKSVWALDLLQQYNNFFGIIVLQFVGHLLGGSAVELMTVSFKNTYAICCISQVCCSQSTCPCSRPLWPVPLQETLKYSKAGLAQALLEVTAPSPVFWCTQGFVFTLQVYLAIEISIFKTRICVFSWKSQKLHTFPPGFKDKYIIIIIQTPIILGLYVKMKYLGDADFAYVYIYGVPLFCGKSWLTLLRIVNCIVLKEVMSFWEKYVVILKF